MKLIPGVVLAALAYGVVGVAQVSKLLPTVVLPSPQHDLRLPQDPKDDGCPPAEMISDSYSTFEAKVLEVTSGNTLIVKSKHGKREVIHMVGIAVPDVKTPFGIASKEHLATLALGKSVEVWLISTNARKATSRQATGIIEITTPTRLDINLEQIKAGMAQHRSFGPYTQDARDRCLYANAEAGAKAARLGIWKQ
jgi:endonuclease YncB( thermonuclease family)